MVYGFSSKLVSKNKGFIFGRDFASENKGIFFTRYFATKKNMKVKGKIP